MVALHGGWWHARNGALVGLASKVFVLAYFINIRLFYCKRPFGLRRDNCATRILALEIGHHFGLKILVWRSITRIGQLFQRIMQYVPGNLAGVGDRRRFIAVIAIYRYRKPAVDITRKGIT